MLPRRKFLQQTGASLATLMANELFAATAKGQIKAVGLQLFTIPQMVADDLNGTLQTLSTIGYREVEFFGPYPFSLPEIIEGWKPIAAQLGISQNAFYGHSVKEVRKMLDDHQMRAPSVHIDINDLRRNIGPAMENFGVLGVKYLGIPSLRTEEKKSLGDYRRLSDEFSQLGEKLSKQGMTFVYHNHGFEHTPIEGQVPLDILLKNSDPKHVKFELDIFWMKAAGAEPVDYLKNYPGRFKLMHLKDASEPIRFPGDGGSPDQWMALFPKITDPGAGVFDIKGIVSQAVRSGVEHFYVEHDLTKDPMRTLKRSFEFLSTI
jgi:sugar phosphate isomerase/epimerase